MGTELLGSSLSTHASHPQIDPAVGSGQGDAAAERPRLPPPSVTGAPSAGPLTPQTCTGQFAGLGQGETRNAN